MLFDHNTLSSELKTILDFIRVGWTWAESADLWFGHGTEDAEQDIRELILGSLHLPYDLDVAYMHARLTMQERQFLASQLKKRILDRIPVPYLTHRSHFAGLEFYVDERVLIPRSPTAELIEQQFAPWVDPSAVNSILELCTGSACMAIACAYAFPWAQVDALDISSDALAVAQINVQKHHLEDQVRLIQSDVWQQCPDQRYDVILANPPYVSQEEMLSLPKEYTHEPRLALFAEREGLAIVDDILHHAARYLTPQGCLIIEVGDTEDTMKQAYPDLPLTWIDVERGGSGVFLLTAEQLNHYFPQNEER